MRAALIGSGISGSLTPAMHEAEARAQGFAYSYGRYDTAVVPCSAMTLDDIISKAEAEGLAGLNITHPHKQEVLALLDQVSEVAEAVGAANTVVFRRGRRIGHNTDKAGFSRAFRHAMGGAQPGSVLVLGAGGAGAAVALALLDEGAKHVHLHDLDADRAGALCARLAERRAGASLNSSGGFDWPDPGGFDGIVNSTPVGMDHHPGVPMTPMLLDPASWVVDIIYFPSETQFLRGARRRGCKVMNGAGMAVHQAAGAFELITGRRADPARMTQNLEVLSIERSRSQVA